MKLTQKLLVALCAIAIAPTACIKKKTTSSCTATLYGSKHTGMDTTFTFGIINPATATSTSIGGYDSRMLNAQGAFNHTDNCYYMLTRSAFSGTQKLYKISLSGTVTSYTAAAAESYAALTYNKVTNKLYCLKKISSTASKIAEVLIAGSSFSVTPLASTAHGNPTDIFDYMTVDNNTGNIYFGTQDDTTTYYVKDVPGAGSTTVVASGTAGWAIFGLRYNSNDNMLYGLKNNYPAAGYNFIKVNPSASTITDIGVIASGINEDFYSTALDPCADHFMISTLTGTSWTTQILEQLNMSGTLVQCDTIAYNFQGMDVKY